MAKRGSARRQVDDFARGAYPQIGMTVGRDQLLGTIAPRVREGVDPSALNLDVQRGECVRRTRVNLVPRTVTVFRGQVNLGLRTLDAFPERASISFGRHLRKYANLFWPKRMRSANESNEK